MAIVGKAVLRVKNLKNHWYPYMQNYALRIGLKGGHRDYVRFIILGRSRSGSNFLRGLLNSHSQIKVFGELFQNEAGIGWAMPGYRESGPVFSRFRQHPVEFLERDVFTRVPPEITAVGFKIFYYHAQSPNWKSIWDYLRDHKAIHVLHIKRKNILATHLSRKLAVQSDQWVNTTGERQQVKSVNLDFQECLDDFTRTREWENEYEQCFKEHPYMDVFYEDLAADHAAEMLRVQQFLGVSPERLEPETFRQSRRPLAELIVNYQELKDRFTGTPWQTFFES